MTKNERPKEPPLGPTREPVVIQCEQCLKQLGFALGSDAYHGNGTTICFACLDRLEKWAKHHHMGDTDA